MKKFFTILFVFISAVCFAQYPLPAEVGFNKPQTAGFTCSDVDATTWINASGVSDTVEKRCMCNFVKQLKDSAVYTPIHAAWFLAAGTSATSPWNMVNPVNSNAAFYLTYTGGITFSTGGAAWNGSTGFANTHVDLSATVTNTNGALWYYSRTNSNVGQPYDMGCSDDFGASTRPSTVICRYNNDFAFGLYGDGSYSTSIANADSRGFFGVNKSGSVQTLVKNGALIQVSSSITSSLSAQPLYLGANNGGGTAQFFTNKQCAFAAVTDSLTSTQWRQFYNCVQAFMTALGINV